MSVMAVGSKKHITGTIEWGWFIYTLYYIIIYGDGMMCTATSYHGLTYSY